MTSLPTVVLPIPWHECLVDLARLVSDETPIVGMPSGPCILFGAHALWPFAVLPRGTIIFNSEHPSTWTPHYRAFMAEYETWSYSKNALAPGAKAFEFTPKTWPALPKVEKDIDVLHFGSMNDRRRAVLSALQSEGLNVHHAFGVFGRDLDALIARSKVVLNVHYYVDPPCFEAARVLPLLAKGATVVCEETPNEGPTWAVPYEGLVDACKRAL